MTSRINAFKEIVNSYKLRTAGKTIPYGIGCAYLGRDRVDTETIKREAELLAMAYHEGFLYYDTAAAYEESEVVVGEFVSQVPRESIFLATKSYVLRNVSPEEAAAEMKLSLESSLNRLQTDYLDLFQIHDILSFSHLLADNGVLEMLLEAKRSGRIRNIGMATRQLELLEAAANHGEFDTILTFSDYTPVDPSAANVILSASRSGLGVINATPLLSGLLTGEDPNRIKVPQGQALQLWRQKRAVKFYKFCQENNLPLLTLALQFPVRQAAIDINLTGPANEGQLLATLAALTSEIPDSTWMKVENWYNQEQADLEHEPEQEV
ncbi:aldo/keto reductase [Paenibacillus psychroresistens]|uniref:Aldo/keto reductase n=1 Tax=Paenibacillus psychroresistens TaxID=1778678 RepID=A0A6B8RFR2_9BACL|nr:aldo/keto reductase [Paenibacillus psychroresistens]QGQ95010.1 aldo/keto reductase [Paenibacillus psychroresistens]